MKGRSENFIVLQCDDDGVISAIVVITVTNRQEKTKARLRESCVPRAAEWRVRAT